MKKGLKKLLVLMLAGMILVGCGVGKTDDIPGIVINDDMSIKSVIVEQFDESLYSVSELKNMIDSEVSDYNSSYGMGKVTSQDPEMSDGNVKVVMNFASASDFAAFNNQRLEVMTLSDAVSQNMLGVGFVNVKDNQLANVSLIDEPDLYYVLITDQIGAVTCPGKIAYVSAGVTTESKTKASISEDMDGLAYIIFMNK